MARFSPSPSTLKLVARIAGTIVLSIVIPLVTSFATDKTGNPLLNSSEQIVLGGLIFLCVMLTGLSQDIGELLQIRQKEQAQWDVQYAFDSMLVNVRTAFIRILNQAPVDENLFLEYYQRALARLSDSIYMASTKQELRLDELTFGTTDLLIMMIAHRARDTIKLVHTLDSRPNNFDFSAWARSYYRELTSLAADKKISIRRLFVYGDKTDLESPLAQKLFAFHTSNSGYDFRVIKRTDWSIIVNGHSMPEAHAEFGLWGDMLAYVAIRSGPTNMEGVYSSLPRLISRLEEVFDAGWRLGTTVVVPPGNGPTTVDELFS